MSFENRLRALEAAFAASKNIDELTEIVNPVDPVFIPASTTGITAGKINKDSIGSGSSGDGFSVSFERTNATKGVEPTSAEFPNPKEGDSVCLKLSDNIIEKWDYESNAWVKKFEFNGGSITVETEILSTSLNPVAATTLNDRFLKVINTSGLTSQTTYRGRLNGGQTVNDIIGVSFAFDANVIAVFGSDKSVLMISNAELLDDGVFRGMFSGGRKIKMCSQSIGTDEDAFFDLNADFIFDTTPATDITNLDANYTAFNVISTRVVGTQSLTNCRIVSSLVDVSSSAGGLTADGTKGILDDSGNARFGGTPTEDLTLTLGSSRNFRIEAEPGTSTYLNFVSSLLFGQDSSVFEMRTGPTTDDSIVGVSGDKTARLSSQGGSIVASLQAIDMFNLNGSIRLEADGRIRINSPQIGTPVVNNVLAIDNADGTIKQTQPSFITYSQTFTNPDLDNFFPVVATGVAGKIHVPISVIYEMDVLTAYNLVENFSLDQGDVNYLGIVNIPTNVVGKKAYIRSIQDFDYQPGDDWTGQDFSFGFNNGATGGTMNLKVTIVYQTRDSII